jgi:hypothetical protein
MASQIEISNFALIALGADPISSLSESTTQAVAINIVWDVCRRGLLRLHPWNFAIKRVELAQSSIKPSHGYEYKFALPSDCLKVIQVYKDEDYKVENNFVLTNSPTAKLKYVADIIDPWSWSVDFTELMTEKLKSELSFSITADKELVKLYHQTFQAKLDMARWNDASEDIEDSFVGVPSLIGVR